MRGSTARILLVSSGISCITSRVDSRSPGRWSVLTAYRARASQKASSFHDGRLAMVASAFEYDHTGRPNTTRAAHNAAAGTEANLHAAFGKRAAAGSGTVASKPTSTGPGTTH